MAKKAIRKITGPAKDLQNNTRTWAFNNLNKSDANELMDFTLGNKTVKETKEGMRAWGLTNSEVKQIHIPARKRKKNPRYSRKRRK